MDLPEEIRNELVNRYDEKLLWSLQEEFEEMLPYLPVATKAIMDIGCGNGAMAALLYKFYGETELNLIEGDIPEAVREVPDGFWDDVIQPWNDVQDAIKFLERQNIIHVRRRPCNPSITIPVDLIYSRMAWGYNFHIRHYIGLAERSVRTWGRVIVDLRKSRAKEQLKTFGQHKFKQIDMIVERDDYQRWVLETTRIRDPEPVGLEDDD